MVSYCRLVTHTSNIHASFICRVSVLRANQALIFWLSDCCPEVVLCCVTSSMFNCFFSLSSCHPENTFCFSMCWMFTCSFIVVCSQSVTYSSCNAVRTCKHFRTYCAQSKSGLLLSIVGSFWLRGQRCFLSHTDVCFIICLAEHWTDAPIEQVKQ
jgi:hypothetical protein